MKYKLHIQHEKVVRPMLGERVSGDTAVIGELEEGVFLGIADVLGHGPEAHEVAVVIEDFLEKYCTSDIGTLMHGLHETLKGSRGAAVGLCFVEAASGLVSFVGTGNTRTKKLGSSEVTLSSKDGIVGSNMRSLRTETTRLEPGDLLVLTTDGIRERFSLDDLPAHRGSTPAFLARTLLRRFGKDYDDAACIVLKYGP
ncbi:MAG: SpoIIE family protein phosphatase [Nitrospirota bacterium]|nr:MAG: SpoIIE family protein phosphatase [Nitrospirota bacterium]